MLLHIVSSTTVSELYFYVLISFSHGYSATLATKLIIKLDLNQTSYCYHIHVCVCVTSIYTHWWLYNSRTHRLPTQVPSDCVTSKCLWKLLGTSSKTTPVCILLYTLYTGNLAASSTYFSAKSKSQNSRIWVNSPALFYNNGLLPRCMECSRGIAMGILSVRPSVRLSVRPSVRLSVKRVHCDKTEESYV